MKFAKPRRKVRRAFVHCTAYAGQDLIGSRLYDAVNAWHKKRWPNLTDSLGQGVQYHALIDCRGNFIPGRNIEDNPLAAQAGHNSQTITVCLDGLYPNQFNDRQIRTLVEFADRVDAAYDGRITWHGHCEVAAKACPVFDYKTALGLDESGRRGGASITADPSGRGRSSTGARTLSMTCSGDDVRYIQDRLDVTVDGIFGQETFRAVTKFQHENDLVPDGIVGPLTWAELREKFGGN